MDVSLFSLVNFRAKSSIFLSVLIHKFLIHSERVLFLLVLACIHCPFLHFALHCIINPSYVFSRAFRYVFASLSLVVSRSRVLTVYSSIPDHMILLC
jgi:hypothetical protein